MKELAFSKKWLNLHYYNKSLSGYKSKATEDLFFFHENGKTLPLGELQAAIEAFKFKDKKWGHIKKSAQCAFPARYKFLKENLPDTFIDDDCPDLDEWMSTIGAKSVHLVYAGVYPNNPASIFGHTFLRFSRGKEVEKQSGSYLLNYTVGFMATTNPSDDAITYTLKGISGGYKGYFEIKPFYLNLGIYNNSESRDLWEYEIKLSEEEVEDLLLHLWEVSQNTGFPYFFFDENCSYYVLRLLEVARPDWNFHQDFSVFVPPSSTVHTLLNKADTGDFGFYPSIKRKLKWKLKQLDKIQIDQFKKGKEDLSILKEISDPFVLESLIDHWNYINYKKRTKLNDSEKALRSSTLARRASLKKEGFFEREKTKNWVDETPGPPHVGHLPHYVATSYGTNKISSFFNLQLGYGFHRYVDNPNGYEDYAFVDALNLKLRYSWEEKSLSIQELKIVDILSLYPTSWSMPALSWRLSLYYDRKSFARNERQETIHLRGGVGLSQRLFYDGFQYFFLLTPHLEKQIKEGHLNFLPSLNFGFKIGEVFTFEGMSSYKNEQLISQLSLRLNTYFSKDQMAYSSLEYFNEFRQENEIEIGYQLNF